MEHQTAIYTLKLRHPFGISRGIATELKTVLFNLGDGRGIGEGAPVRYKNQDAEAAVPLLERMAALVTEHNIDDIEGLHAAARKIAGGHSAALTAFDTALWDARARKEGVTLHAHLKIGPPLKIQTTYTVSLTDHETMETRAREASHMPLLKVKLGRSVEFDLEAMRRIRAAAPNSVLRVDANAGWTLDQALEIVPQLERMGVDLVEQPLAIGNIEENYKLRKSTPLPIVVDEDAQDMTSLPALRNMVNGINIKLMKCGGVTEALKMIAFAREEGWSILIGCMIETHLGLTTGAHLGSIVDHLDLDAHMLTINDPFPPGSSKVLHPEPLLHGGTGLGLEWPASLNGSAAN